MEFYFEQQKIYETKFGKKTVIFMQFGSFYEVYEWNGIGKASDVAKICNMMLSQKQDVYMCGTKQGHEKRMINCLIDHNYTIVIFDQKEDDCSQRIFKRIVSPGTHVSLNDETTICGVYIEQHKTDIFASVAYIHTNTGKCGVHNVSDRYNLHFKLEELYRIVEMLQCKEVIIFTSEKYPIIEKLPIYIKKQTTKNALCDIYVQNDILKRIYDIQSVLSGIEYLGIDNYIGSTAFASMLSFLDEYKDETLLHIQKPTIHDENTLVLHNSTMYQLGMFHDDLDLHKLLNKTSTPMGKRLFTRELKYPYICTEQIKRIHDDVDKMTPIWRELENDLNLIKDIDTLQRKISVETITFYEMYMFITSFETIFKIISRYDTFDNNRVCIGDLVALLKLLHCFDTEALKNNILCDVFKPGTYPDLDEIYAELQTHKKDLDNICKKFSRLILETKSKNVDNVVVYYEYKENANELLVYATEARCNILKKIEKIDVTKGTSGKFIIKNDKIRTISNKYEQIQNDIKPMFKTKWNDTLKKIYNAYSHTVSEYIAYIDVIKSKAKCSELYEYTKPSVVNEARSYIKCKNLRHPIVERLDLKEKYIGNDVDLKERCGVLLYGVNGSGKSCYSKSIGLSIIMAQTGSFVPSTEYEISPFHRIFTRISSDDNIHKSLSSFFVEMTELKSILDFADERSIIIGDEVCKGTEDISALSIVTASCILWCQKQIKFVLATHLHAISNLKSSVTMLPFIDIKHMDVVMNKGSSPVFTRLIKDGQGPTFYGLDIANFILKNDDLKEYATMIKNEIAPTKKGYKKSKYNSKLNVNECYFCKNTSHLETHHIIEQSKCHDNSLSNLVPVCSKCHHKIHDTKEIIVKGWKKSMEGNVLDYEVLM